MNERIEVLALQAFGSTIDNDPILVYEAEKFAELIVRECVKFCKHESNDDEHDEYDMGMWVKAESIKTAIMKEFGIKE